MLFNTEIIRKTESGFKRASQIDDGQQWLTEIKNRMRKEKRLSEVIFLSPSRAKALLAANPNNRTISSRTTNVYAADIANGRWVFNGEPIILAETGELNDGQHRCEAVVLAGRGIETLFVAGVPRSTRTTVDMGRARTTGDFLQMHAIENSRAIATAANILLCFETGRLMGAERRVSKGTVDLAAWDARPTKQEILTFACANIDDLQKALRTLNQGQSYVVGSWGRFAGVLAILARHSRDWRGATEFVSAIVEGDNLKKGSPEYLVRDRLLSEKRSRGTLGVIRFMEIVVRGWNAYRTGQKIQRIQTAGFVPEVAK